MKENYGETIKQQDMAEIYEGKIMFAVGERIECKTHTAVCTPHDEIRFVCKDCVFCGLATCNDIACIDHYRRDGVNVYFPYVRKEVQ